MAAVTNSYAGRPVLVERKGKRCFTPSQQLRQGNQACLWGPSWAAVVGASRLLFASQPASLFFLCPPRHRPRYLPKYLKGGLRESYRVTCTNKISWLRRFTAGRMCNYWYTTITINWDREVRMMDTMDGYRWERQCGKVHRTQLTQNMADVIRGIRWVKTCLKSDSCG